MGPDAAPRGGTEAATLPELRAFLTKDDGMGVANLGTAALIGREWPVREVSIVGSLGWADDRPGDKANVRPTMTNVRL